MQQPSGKPKIIVLALERHMSRLLRAGLEMEEYDVKTTRGAEETLAILEHDRAKYIVLMDKFQASGDARTLTQSIFAWPGLYRRVKVIGLAARQHEQLMRLDALIEMPFALRQLLVPIEWLSAALMAGG